MKNLAMSAILLLMCQPTFGAISVGLSGASSKSNYSLETQKSSIISANVSVSFLSFLRVGLTHRRSFTEKTGLKKAETPSQVIYYEFEDNTDIITNSIDLTAVLYPGVVSPFVFGGIARRDYYTEVRYPGSEAKGETTLPAVPNYGAGLAIRLSHQFSLKITQTYTPGIATTIENGEEVSRVINDTYSQIGISYQL